MVCWWYTASWLSNQCLECPLLKSNDLVCSVLYQQIEGNNEKKSEGVRKRYKAMVSLLSQLYSLVSGSKTFYLFIYFFKYNKTWGNYFTSLCRWRYWEHCCSHVEIGFIPSASLCVCLCALNFGGY